MITKQDVEQIAKRLSQMSAKDSQFPTVGSTDSPVSFPVLSNGKNALLSPEKFAEYISKHIDLSKVSVGSYGNVSTLKNLLDTLYEMSSSPTLIDGTKLLAGMIFYHDPRLDTSYPDTTNVGTTLTAIIDMLFNPDNVILHAATQQDINNILNNTQL